MTSRLMGLVLALAILTLPSWAERIKTDGNNKLSPVQVKVTDFTDTGYGMPGPQATIQMSAEVKNTSTVHDLRNVTVELQVKNLKGDVVQKWTKNISELKRGSTQKVESDSLFYNTVFTNLQGAVEVTHDKPIETGKK